MHTNVQGRCPEQGPNVPQKIPRSKNKSPEEIGALLTTRTWPPRKEPLPGLVFMGWGLRSWGSAYWSAASSGSSLLPRRHGRLRVGSGLLVSTLTSSCWCEAGPFSRQRPPLSQWHPSPLA